MRKLAQSYLWKTPCNSRFPWCCSYQLCAKPTWKLPRSFPSPLLSSPAFVLILDRSMQSEFLTVYQEESKIPQLYDLATWPDHCFSSVSFYFNTSLYLYYSNFVNPFSRLCLKSLSLSLVHIINTFIKNPYTIISICYRTKEYTHHLLIQQIRELWGSWLTS